MKVDKVPIDVNLIFEFFYFRSLVLGMIAFRLNHPCHTRFMPKRLALGPIFKRWQSGILSKKDSNICFRTIDFSSYFPTKQQYQHFPQNLTFSFLTFFSHKIRGFTFSFSESPINWNWTKSEYENPFIISTFNFKSQNRRH